MNDLFQSLKQIAFIIFLLIFGSFIFPQSDLARIGLEGKSVAQIYSKFKKPDSAGGIIGINSGQILVKFRDDAPAEKRKEILNKLKLAERSEINEIGVKILEVSSEVPPARIAADLGKENAFIEFAEPDYFLEPSFIPDDPWFANWQKDKIQINAPTAWDYSAGDQGLIVAVVDTGVNCGHEDLFLNCIAGRNLLNNSFDTADESGHGTKVAGVIATAGNNSLGVAGAVWVSRIMPLKVSDASGYASYSAIANAIVYAADNGAKVVNNSYQSGASQTVERAGRYLKNKGGTLVVSAGNSGVENTGKNSAYVVTVSAVDAADNIYSWSNFGRDIDVSAPGCTGATTAINGGYASFCGTSNSAPEVSGVFMLVWSANPALSAGDAEKIVFDSAKDLGESGWDKYFGWGRVDAGAAIQAAINFKDTSVQNRQKGR